MAYASDLPQQTEAALHAGHELIVHVPMEPIGRAQDISQKTLADSVGRDEVLRRLRWDLGRFDGYVGINNHMGSRFSSDPNALQTIIEELKARGLLFLDSRTVGAAGNSVAERLGVPTASRDVFIDEEINAVAINTRLGDLEANAPPTAQHRDRHRSSARSDARCLDRVVGEPAGEGNSARAPDRDRQGTQSAPRRRRLVLVLSFR